MEKGGSRAAGTKADMFHLHPLKGKYPGNISAVECFFLLHNGGHAESLLFIVVPSPCQRDTSAATPLSSRRYVVVKMNHTCELMAFICDCNCDIYTDREDIFVFV